MSLKVYFPEDIENALRAVEHPTRRLLGKVAEGDKQYARGYQAGYHDALAALALAFGLVNNENHPT